MSRFLRSPWLALATLANFLNWVETRPGVVLDDPILALFLPVDLTWLTFGLIYLGLLCGIVFLTRHPRAMLIAFQSYVLMVAVRIAAMYRASSGRAADCHPACRTPPSSISGPADF